MNAIITKAKALIAQIQLDDTGMMVGQQWMGGNGGLLSRETIKCADDLRRAIEQAVNAALTTTERKLLLDPNAVHINMLRGEIARPSIAQIIHIYGTDELRRAIEQAERAADETKEQSA